GDVQYFQVTVSNENAFLHPAKGTAKKGSVSLTPFAGLHVEPQQFDFTLKNKDTQKFIFKVTNDKWDVNKIRLRPIITIASSEKPVSNLVVGTLIVRDQALIDTQPLDEDGLLMFCGYDDLSKNGKFDMCNGNPRPYHYPNHTTPYYSNGVKNNCTSSSPSCNIYSPYRNVDHRSGTALFWVKRDPIVKNEFRYKGNPKTSYKDASPYKYETLFWTPGIQVYRFPDWSDKPGYVQVIYQEMFGEGEFGPRQVVNVPYSKKEQYEWTHWAVAWDVKKKHLAVYKNGILAATAEKTQRPWYACPWDLGDKERNWDLIINTQDHGRLGATLRDEVYIYDRALPAAKVMSNMKKVRK
ncbi:MAG: hypothetical protein HRU15_09020, partial [Planctomycetes bacterium]|nr:hypothetical protein [Planctomycetota bacterium]